LPLFLKGLTWVDFRQANPDPMQQLIFGITGNRNSAQDQSWQLSVTSNAQVIKLPNDGIKAAKFFDSLPQE
jgi:hypothetical protein